MTKRSEQKAVVAERGQVTIPKSLRDKLGISPGTVVKFELTADNTIMVTKDPSATSMSAVYGCLKGRTSFKSTDQYMKRVRGAAE